MPAAGHERASEGSQLTGSNPDGGRPGLSGGAEMEPPERPRPPTRIVRPGERFEYTLLANRDHVPLLRAEGTYRTWFEFTSIACP